MAFSPLALADNRTVTMGYSQSKVQDLNDIKGVNLKYRYGWNSPVSIINSFTCMSGSEDKSCLVEDITKGHLALTYYSLAAGPAYRLNNYIGIYGLIGLNYSKGDARVRWNNDEGDSYHDMGTIAYSGKKTTFMYGAGLQLTPAENRAVDVGYEGSSYKDDIKTRSINGFHIGVGYRF